MAQEVDIDKLIEEMFHAALKEKFSRFARKYDPQTVFEVWTEFMASHGEMAYFQKCGWNADMTIQKALDGLADCCDSIEDSIRERLRLAKPIAPTGNVEKENF